MRTAKAAPEPRTSLRSAGGGGRGGVAILDAHHWIPRGQDLASTTISHSFGLVMITKAQPLRPSASRSSVNGPVLVQQGCSVVTAFTESWLNRVD